MGDGDWRIDEAEGGRLAARWWQWALSAPEDRSPVSDTTGRYADWRQPEDLWFLAGTYGGRVVRRCGIPAGRPVFFPVLNTERKAVPFVTRPWRLDVERAEADLNGSPLSLSEFSSKPFPVMGIPRIAWGLWCGLSPLPAGQFVLEIKAAAKDGFWVDTTYHLSVE
ncbi:MULTISPECIES: hypothetical protein [unclassified Streptomyces]|uniref:hypothetical protein n=1 Tax=unclassified Streptomyces TaxID=2593676 RepID=UPI001BEB183A|nr:MULTISPECIES: hypothetical protein [unclassified Streptomyces]MBT2402515.1 hypothetical protein [Streptomyces sp. ISL-21]MBT2460016.1 hypothetical protein [Streptomyces sp. ISL-86]MBT2610257.1 hypothetical protein [Streptomyces sp. ISL-87]